MADADLIGRSLDGDGEAFEALFHRHCPAIHRFLLACVGPDAADEMLPGLLDDPDEFHAVDILFHVRLAEASANEPLGDMVRELLNTFTSNRAHYPVGHIDLERALIIQRDTLDAIIDGSRDESRGRWTITSEVLRTTS